MLLYLVHVSCNFFEVTPESVFSDPNPLTPRPRAVSGCVWFVVLDSCPEDYSLLENKAPQCVLCFPHSLALTSAVWQEGGGLHRLCAVRDPSPPCADLHLDPAVWLADPGRVGGPSRHLLPAQVPPSPSQTKQSKGCFTYHMLFCGIN